VASPLGADAVIPSKPSRLARLRLATRRRVEVRGRVHVERGVRITTAPGARVILERDCMLGAGCRIEAKGGTVRIGPRARLGERTVLVALAGIDVGADCVVGEWAMVCDAQPTGDDPEHPTRLQPVKAQPLRIGDRARIGAHAAILAGARIAPGELVGSYETRPPRSVS
jgi:acetyltransferase-like isoleucine patch superfamily enzyme